jgi:hypothetical protein
MNAVGVNLRCNSLLLRTRAERYMGDPVFGGAVDTAEVSACC